MATADRSLNAPTPSATTARLLLLATFVAAIILSASLLFMVQPMFTKLVLPKAADPGQRVWTDDYCNIVGALIRKLTE